MLRVHPWQATKDNNELAGAQNRPGRRIWRSVRDATPGRPGPPGPDYGSSPQRGGAALPFELHNARVRGDGSAEGGAYGVCRTYSTPTQLPVANKDEQVLLHNILIHSASLRLRQTVIPRAAQTEPNGCMAQVHQLCPWLHVPSAINCAQMTTEINAHERHARC